MKITFAGDCHLGFKSLPVVTKNGLNVRENDIYTSFIWFVKKVEELDPDLVVIAGDLFDKAEVGGTPMGVAFKLVSLHKPVFIVEGNHDRSRGNSFFSSTAVLNFFENVRVFTEPELVEFKGYSFYMVPFYEEFSDFTPADFLVGHLRDRRAPKYKNIGIDIPEGKYNLIILGDLHEPLKLGDHTYYTGTLDHLSFENAHAKCGFYLWEDGKLSYIENNHARPYVTLYGKPNFSVKDAVVRIKLNYLKEEPEWVKEVRQEALYVKLELSTEGDRTFEVNTKPENKSIIEMFDDFVSARKIDENVVKIAKEALVSCLD